MGSMLDLVGSFLIGGLLLLTILAFNRNVDEMSTADQLELLVQGNLNELVSEIEYDFRKIGYRVANPALAIISADTSTLSFRADLDNNGSLETVTYQLGPIGEMRGTLNPRDRILRRTVNNQTSTGSLGVVTFRLTYYDIGGVVTTNPALIKSLDYRLIVENPFPVETFYARSVWNGTIRPRNL